MVPLLIIMTQSCLTELACSLLEETGFTWRKCFIYSWTWLFSWIPLVNKFIEQLLRTRHYSRFLAQKMRELCCLSIMGGLSLYGSVAMDGKEKWGWVVCSYMRSCYIISKFGSKTSILCNQQWDIWSIRNPSPMWVVKQAFFVLLPTRRAINITTATADYPSSTPSPGTLSCARMGPGPTVLICKAISF